jgi:hypothetical protein
LPARCIAGTGRRQQYGSGQDHRCAADSRWTGPRFHWRGKGNRCLRTGGIKHKIYCPFTKSFNSSSAMDFTD